MHSIYKYLLKYNFATTLFFQSQKNIIKDDKLVKSKTDERHQK